ncbi:hypothetical protein F5X68DRAFT_197419 [Plectosphaerella plurivora]|uniref:C3H1-type domain-containing protein n=1 Tax=Plectosphaerella plurivora TaxID=936078 RepID=A0A9P8VKZ0_9PEZI|nr:hypothetical protein F5X68DRAFT_197419 [Plectosphaerella plurivora]
MSYHAQGYNQSHGQPGQQFPYPPPSGPAFPGLQMHYAQPAFTQNHNLIPGLAFGNSPSPGIWNPPPPPAEPKLVPAARYYQPIQTPAKTVAPIQKPPVQTASQPADSAAEEGEISEGQFDDLYEPADATVIHHDDGPDDYDPANPSWMTAPTTHLSGAPHITPTINGTSKNAQGPASDEADSSRSAREASDSYSPYLSPREYHDQLAAMPPAHAEPQKYTTALVNAQASPRVPSADDMATAKQQAHAAVLQLLPFNIGFDDYVREGVDPSVLRSVFSELGLDPSTTTTPVKTKTNAANTAATRTQSATKTTKEKSPKVQKPAPVTAASSAASLADRKAEERKDRIARLWAAKGAKNGSTQPSASTVKAGSDQPTASSQTDRTEKETVLQQKMEALRKSREARAQKAASKTEAAPIEPAATQAAQVPEVAAESPPQQSQKGLAIPGLAASTAGPASSPANSRKRPVAADFVDEAPLHVSKRPFGQDRGDRFVIDVSEESDDEDVEMELGSGDEAAVLRSGPYIQRTTSFRDVPQLTNAFNQRQPFSSPGGKPSATPPNGLANMDKKIEEMKKKIALAEARKKLKLALGNRKGTTTPNSTLPTTDVSPGMIIPKPALRRVQSLDVPAASDELAVSATERSSPALPEAPIQLRLPKLSDLSAEDRKQRQDRFRSLSHSLPLVDGKLQAKVKKLHLLQTQITRLEKEIAQESAEKQKMEAELEILQPAMEASESPEAENTPEASEEPSHAQMAYQPPTTSEEATPGSASTPLDDDEAGGVALQSEVTELEASRPAADITVGTTSETTGDQPGSRESSSRADSAMETSSDGLVEETEEAQPIENEEDAMQVDDEPTGQEEDSDDVVDLTNRGTDESQQATPEPQAGPSQISVGVNDSRPDEGLDGLRESRQGGRSGSRQVDETVFKPYQTPFNIFRDFRYHPSFATQVPGGLRSLTYSNKIDPKHPVCPNQLDGRQCPKGADCEYQHFETMKLPDDQILLQLGGTKLQGAERNRFNAGLRELLHDLREKNIKDFPRIAQGIVDFHNRFSGDPSKVLSLGDIPL